MSKNLVNAIILMALVLLIMAACGGGRNANRSVLPGISGGGPAVSTDRGFTFTEADIPNLDPQIQELLAHPGWSGPPSPVPPVSGAPMPPPYSVEDSLSLLRELVDETEQLARSGDPVVPVRGTSYQQVPPPPDYFPECGEYDPEDYEPPATTPPFGVDDDENYREDLFEAADEFGITTFASFVKRGLTIQNQFNRGTMTAGAEVSAVYQKARGPGSAVPNIELVYREAESGLVPNPYRLEGPTHQLFNLLARLRKISDPTPMFWYAVVIAPSSEYQDNGGLFWESAGCPNETFGGIQAFAYDPAKLPLLQADTMDWDENGSLVGSLFCKLESSEHNLIQELIDTQSATGQPSAAFPVMGMILQRWIDDRFSPFQEPWEGRLGWPLGLPVINRDGRVITGPLGQYYQYYQYFEKGFMWWNDYIDPNTPDELYIYMYSKDCTLETGGEYEQDPMVVRYGMGGPLGMAVTAWPLLANVGDPIYYHAFPYGGPAGNVNAFLDDFFVWNFRDGNYYIGDGTDTLQVHEYYTEAKFVTRVMLVLDVDGDGNADGATPEYVYFADAPEVEIGHLGEGGGGGGGEPTLLVVQDNTGGGYGNSLVHLNAVTGDLDNAGWDDIYDTKTTGEITNVSQLQEYLCVIWCPSATGFFFTELIDAGERSRLTSYILGGGNVVMCNDTMYNSSMGYPTWQYLFGAPFDWSLNPGYDPGVNLTGGPAGSGPGGAVAVLNKNAVWCNLAFDYQLQPNTTVVGRSTYNSQYITALTRDNLPSAAGGRTACFGTTWNEYTTTQPSGVGRSGVLLNLLNYIDPNILVHTGGSGGDIPIVPWDGPVDIADVFAWVYDTNGASISGGDGDTALERAIVSVISDPKQIWFECVARAAADIDLVYEWEFEPSAGFGIWTRYTAHSYIGGIDPDGEGPQDEGDPFPVNVRVYDSSFTYATAPPESRDFDSVLVEVHGALPIDIDDNGTVFADSYEPDEVTGDVTVTLNYKIQFGAPPYDSVWVDYDYDFMSFNDLVEVTPTPGEGVQVYNVVIPEAQSREYYIAIRVYDSDAPNLMDTYAWLTPVNVASDSIVVVNDGGTANFNAITDDLDTLGASYVEMQRSEISDASDLQDYMVVIWCPPDTSGAVDTTEQTLLYNYINDGGNLFLPFNWVSSCSVTTFRSALGFTGWGRGYGGVPYGYWQTGSGSMPYDGPGGTINWINTTDSVGSTTLGYSFYRVGSPVRLWYWLGTMDTYWTGAGRHNGTVEGKGWGTWSSYGWNNHTSTSPTTPGRSGALWNILDYMVEDII